jgi:predicted O-methyltransferase YrrM
MLTADQYAEKYTSAQNNLLQEILDYTLKNHPSSNMISGHVQGQLLSLISKIIQPSRILEIGTFTGFSALCLAEGLNNDGLLYTLELRDADADTAQAYFNRSNYSNKIKLLRGNAIDLIPGLNEEWDLVFIDADKTGYINYYDLVLPALKPGGIILADNVLFHGEVLSEPIKGKNAIAIAAFNEHISKDHRIEHALLTVRDGLMMIRKK